MCLALLLLGGLLALANYFIRKHLQETPAFAELQSARPQTILSEPLKNLWLYHRASLASGLGMTVLVASLVIFNLYLPAYLSKHFHYALSDVYLAMTWGLVWSALSLPVCGYLCDKLGRAAIFLGTCVGFILLAFPLFYLMTNGNLSTLIAALVIYQTAISFLMASYFPLLAAAFAVHVRYTGIAFCYNVAYAVMGCLPIGLTLLIEKMETPVVAIWVLIGCALISIVSFRQNNRSIFAGRN